MASLGATLFCLAGTSETEPAVGQALAQCLVLGTSEPELKQLLPQGLTSDDVWVRRYAYEAVTKARAREPRVVPILLQQLLSEARGEGDDRFWGDAEKALAATGEAGIAAARSLLDEHDLRLRLAGLRVLEHVRLCAPDLVDQVQRLARTTPVSAERNAAAQTLAALGRVDQALELLKTDLDDTRPEVRRDAARAASTLGHAGAVLVPQLARVLEAEWILMLTSARHAPDAVCEPYDSTAVVAVALYLGALERQAAAALPALRRWQAIPASATARYAATAASYRIAKRRADFESLRRTAQNKNTELERGLASMYLYEAAKSMPREAAERTMRELDSAGTEEDEAVRASLVRTLVWLSQGNEAQARRVANIVMTDQSGMVRGLAVSSIREMRVTSGPMIKVLRAALDDSDPAVQFEAVLAIRAANVPISSPRCGNLKP